MIRRKAVLDYAAYIAVRTAVCVIQAASLQTCMEWARRLAWLLWHVVRLRRDVIEENLQIAFPQAGARERQAIAIAMWEHLLVMVAEISQAPRKVHRYNWREHLSAPQLAMMTRRLLDRRP